MKTLNILVTIYGGDSKIGGNHEEYNLSHRCVKSFDMDRNFSDIANKFSMTLIDHPTSTVNFIDLEVAMARGYRNIKVSYTDQNDNASYNTFNGTIWDYDVTFVGDMKQLSISGYLSKTSGQDYSGEYSYNIDWNSYYNLRANPNLPWNCLTTYAYKAQKTLDWETKNNKLKDSGYHATLNSATSDKNFVQAYNINSQFALIQGPPGGKAIKIPIPAAFTTMIPHMYMKENDPSSDVGDCVDPDNRFWGKLSEISLTDYLSACRSKGVCYNPSQTSIYGLLESAKLDEVGQTVTLYVQGKISDITKAGGLPIRGFSLDGGETGYIEMNPNKEYYGAAQMIKSQVGVDISYIVRQLADLEGWKVGNIVQTELVPCSDKFKMNGQTAKQFIQEVLVPMAITPVGSYYSTKGNGSQVVLTKGVAGFALYFKDNEVYFEPISVATQKQHGSVTKNINLGYNIQDSPVISFKVNTKGTAFYTNSSKINSMTIATGQQIDSVIVSDGSAVDELMNKTKGHSESLDNYYGYTYEYVKDKFGTDAKATNGWVGIGNKYDSAQQAYISSWVQKGLVNRISNSAVSGTTEAIASVQDVKDRIKNFTIQATMNLWGDVTISPNTLIKVTNMVKQTNANIPDIHPTSGTYLVYKQHDTYDQGNFQQQLSLIRSTKDVEISDNIDWSRHFNPIREEFNYQPLGYGGGGGSR